MVQLSGTLSAGALGLDMARLLALVADLLTAARVFGAVTGEVATLAAVVTFAAINTVARHVANTTARVASLVLLETAAAAAIAARLVATSTATVGVTALTAVAGNVADLTALVALGTGRATTATAGGSRLGAVTRDMAGSTTSVAGFGVLWTLGAITAHVALATAVVALSSTTVGTVTGLMRGLAACEAGASTTLLAAEIHFVLGYGWLKTTMYFVNSDGKISPLLLFRADCQLAEIRTGLVSTGR